MENNYHVFPASKCALTIVKVGNINSLPTTRQLEEIRDLIRAGYVSLEGMTNISVERLPEITNDDTYVFIVSSNDSYDLNAAEEAAWREGLADIENTSNRTLFMTPLINIRRIKKDLVPFL